MMNSRGHGAKADSNLQKDSENYPLDIDAVAQLARLYASGTPPEVEIRLIKERINAASDELPNKQNGARRRPKESQTAQETRSGEVTYDQHTADVELNQRNKTIRETSEFSAELRLLESSIRVVPRPLAFEDQFVRAGALMNGRLFHIAFFSFAAVVCLTLCWHSHEAKEIVSRWALSMDRLLSISTGESPPALATFSEPPRGRALPPGLTAARLSANQFDAQQERTYPGGSATHRVKQDARSKTSSPPRTLR
jgi:hypothetical protein